MILDSCTFTWHTGQLTISGIGTEEELALCSAVFEDDMAEDDGKCDEEEAAVLLVTVAVALFWCSLEEPDAAEAPLPVALVWPWEDPEPPAFLLENKSKRLGVPLRLSHDLFLEGTAEPEAAPGAPWFGLDIVVAPDGYFERVDGGLTCCLGLVEESVELCILPKLLPGDEGAFPLPSVKGFGLSVMLKLSKSSFTDFCLAFKMCPPVVRCLTDPSATLPLLGLGILTGDPLMLTKYFVLATERFVGGLFPPGLVRGKAPELFSPRESRKASVGEPRLVRDGGENGGRLGEETVLGKGLFQTGLGDFEEAEGCDPPRTTPFPLNGIMFLMSCDPEPERLEYKDQNKLWIFF